MKITPAHDANDFEVGQRHELADAGRDRRPSGIAARSGQTRHGRVPAELTGLDRFEAREKIVEMLKARGRVGEGGAAPARRAALLSLRHGGRAAPVGPVVREDEAARRAGARRRVRDGAHPHPARALGSVYINWLENIRDWNISRQLWWGHRMPVWYCDECDPPRTSSRREDLTSCPHCGGPVRQDEDVLDTWFSSWLWPFSTLGWPNENADDLRAFYPTDVLVTAPEILFFWVARMIMAGYEFMGEAPFHTVYLHGTVRDTQHRKMSKSLGNGIDPLDVVHALRRRRAALDGGRRHGPGRRRHARSRTTSRSRSRPGRNFVHEALEHRAVPARHTWATSRCSRVA